MKHLIENNTMYITFKDSEVKYMKQMLEMELDDELKAIDEYTRELRKALEDKDIKRIKEIEKNSTCITMAYKIEEYITKLEDTQEFAVLLNIMVFRFMDRLKTINNREFVEGFKELLKIAIEDSKSVCLKEAYLKELAEI